MSFAVIETGGKQYRVRAGDVVRVEKLGEGLSAGQAVAFDKVLLKAEGEKAEIGTPYLEGAHVEAKVRRALRGDRKMIFRYHSKTRYRKKRTHRQWYTEVEITKIPV
jgi:large subunit ribosomal protein L21